MQNGPDTHLPPSEQIRDARDLLTRLYREIGISAVAAALEAGKEHPRSARPPVDILRRVSPESSVHAPVNSAFDTQAA